jgi:ElaB/YqjD/DUF883 family membrane-anchored ribosome-binding protein
MAERQQSKERAGGEGNGFAFGFSQATEAVNKLRAVVDQATSAIKDLTQVSEEWVQQAQGRGREVAKQLGQQSDWATGKITETVEHNPMASLIVAFVLGFFMASLIKR